MPRIKALIGVVVVVGFFYLAWNLVPPYLANYQFQQEIQTVARDNMYTPLDENGIRDQVKRKISDIGVPINPDNVVIVRNGQDVTIGANYSVHVNLAVHPVDLTFLVATKDGDKIDSVPTANP
ncbi:MAG TPA: DUF4845 domain-containing protein [Terriglobales bacterium]|nr:DUF4845 domain-containing protein [Terriglobales bacterium]